MADSQYPEITAFQHLYGTGYYVDYAKVACAVFIGEDGAVRFAEGIGNGRLNTGAVHPDSIRRFEFDEQAGLVSVVLGVSDSLSVAHIIGATQKKEAAQAWVRDVNRLYEPAAVERAVEAEMTQEEIAHSESLWRQKGFKKIRL